MAARPKAWSTSLLVSSEGYTVRPCESSRRAARRQSSQCAEGRAALQHAHHPLDDGRLPTRPHEPSRQHYVSDNQSRFPGRQGGHAREACPHHEAVLRAGPTHPSEERSHAGVVRRTAFKAAGFIRLRPWMLRTASRRDRIAPFPRFPGNGRGTEDQTKDLASYSIASKAKNEDALNQRQLCARTGRSGKSVFD